MANRTCEFQQREREWRKRFTPDWLLKNKRSIFDLGNLQWGKLISYEGKSKTILLYFFFFTSRWEDESSRFLEPTNDILVRVTLALIDFVVPISPNFARPRVRIRISLDKKSSPALIGYINMGKKNTKQFSLTYGHRSGLNSRNVCSL